MEVKCGDLSAGNPRGKNEQKRAGSLFGSYNRIGSYNSFFPSSACAYEFFKYRFGRNKSTVHKAADWFDSNIYFCNDYYFNN